MPGWNEMGAALSTLRELDVSAIREESERSVTIICLAERGLFEQAAALLRTLGRNRYGASGADPLLHRPLTEPGPDDELRRADLLLILLDGRRPLPTSLTAPLGRLAALAVPTVIVISGVATPGELGPPRPEFAHAQIVVVADLVGAEAASSVATAMLARLPGELHLAAARRLPGLREKYTRDLIGAVSFANASFATVSALPQQIPILAVPFFAADMIVLTKNQALMVYRMALGYGAPADFKDRLREVGPVVGGGFFWRQIARSLIGLVPVWGVVPKVAVAYAGTYATGMAAWRWFSDSELLSQDRLRQITAEAMRLGRERAVAITDAAKAQGEQARKGLFRLRLPGRPAPGGAPPPAEKQSPKQ